MAGQLTIDTLKASSGVLATQNGMTGIAKAWLRYNATTTTINASYNISSVTRVSAGILTITFSTAMPDANYAICGSTSSGGDATGLMVNGTMGGAATLNSTTQVQIRTATAAGGAQDCYNTSFVVLGN